MPSLGIWRQPSCQTLLAMARAERDAEAMCDEQGRAEESRGIAAAAVGGTKLEIDASKRSGAVVWFLNFLNFQDFGSF